MNLDELLAVIEVNTNRNEDEKRKREARERGAKAMQEALGRAEL